MCGIVAIALKGGQRDLGKEFEFEIKSTWGKVVVLALIAFVIVYNTIGTTPEPEAVKAIRTHLHHGGYLRHALEEFNNAGGVEADNAEELAQDLVDTARAEVEIVSIKAKGLGDKPVVRVEFLVDGEPPEGEDSVQYFRLYNSSFRGWQVEHKTTALAYYLPFIVD